MKISELSFGLFGFSAQIYSYGEEKALSKILTYLAGPVCNLLIAFIFYFTKVKIELVYINFILGILNLLPIMPLDRWKNSKRNIKEIFWA